VRAPAGSDRLAAAAQLARYEQQVAAARAALGNGAGIDAAWQKGRAMTMERAIDLALREPE